VLLLLSFMVMCHLDNHNNSSITINMVYEQDLFCSLSEGLEYEGERE